MAIGSKGNAGVNEAVRGNDDENDKDNKWGRCKQSADDEKEMAMWHQLADVIRTEIDVG